MKKGIFSVAIFILFAILIIYSLPLQKEQPTEEVTPQIETPKAPKLEQPKQVVTEEYEEPKAYTIDILYQKFEPEELTIEKGSTVTWINKDTKNHKIYHNTNKNKEFYSEVLAPGDSFSHEFNKEGTYDYGDAIFKYMAGKITIEESSAITGNAIINALSRPRTIIPLLLYFLVGLTILNVLAYKRKHITRKLNKTIKK